ncbi:TolB family protein [candidate division KSB1 bacterium]
MKDSFNVLSIILILGVMVVSCNQNKETNPKNELKFAKLTGPYLGQKPQGMKAEIFAPSLLSCANRELSITFSPDEMECCYTFYTPGGSNYKQQTGVLKKWFIMYAHMENGHWTEPAEFSFNPDLQERYPFFSPDGKRIYFNSYRNWANPPDSSSTYIWYVERQNGEWNEPEEIDFGKGFTGRRTAMFPTAAANGNLYFTLFPDGMNGVIYMSRYENGKYSSPERLSDAINDQGGSHPYIAPDESYIIYDWENPEDNNSSNDLMISFRDKNGNWMKPLNLGERVNSTYDERRPFVSFDRKYLFFASDRIENTELQDNPLTLKELKQLTNVPAKRRQHIYWVDAKVIEELKPDELK